MADFASLTAWAAVNPVPVLFMVFCTLVFLYNLLISPRSPIAAPEPEESAPLNIGEVTLEQLKGYDGNDVTKPILLSVRGKIFDVSKGKDFYGPGGGYNVFAGNECARALAKMSLLKEDLTGNLEGVTETQLGTLKDWEDKFNDKYPMVGTIKESKLLTKEELATYNGEDPSKPILLSIRGTVYDVTRGKGFYGPDGAYPFAGKEVARALAKSSLDPKV